MICDYYLGNNLAISSLYILECISQKFGSAGYYNLTLHGDLLCRGGVSLRLKRLVLNDDLIYMIELHCCNHDL